MRVEATLRQKLQAVYRIQEFATLAGVTVRALRHYDRLGLLRPTARSGAGYRLSRESDLARFEQIIVLKFDSGPSDARARSVSRTTSTTLPTPLMQAPVVSGFSRTTHVMTAIEILARSKSRSCSHFNCRSSLSSDV